MKLPLSWVKDFVDIDVAAEELAQKLIAIGFEVEEIIYLGKGITNTITGKITKITKHPNADKLSVCTVDTGNEVLTIVTGATNVNEGDVVPVALDGADLPCGKHIKTSPLRGVVSQGMLCSGFELLIDDSVIEGAEVDGILILPPDTPVGVDIKDILGLNDYVLDISVTPNRPDCQSIYGICREIAAVYGKKIKPINLSYTEDKSKQAKDFISIEIKDYDICSRYIGAVVTEVKVGPSPKWLRDRLVKAGIRPINNIVDITNYVLIETGQPMHAFDYSLIRGGKIIARRGIDGEKIIALDEKQYTLIHNIAVIADTERALAIAGVMGSEDSGINDNTKTVVFESARFPRAAIRHASRALGLSSPSSAMFSRGLDWGSSEIGMKRALSLIEQLKCGKIQAGLIDCNNGAPKKRVIKTTIPRIEASLGIKLDSQKVLDILNALEIKSTLNGNELICEPPVFRDDLEGHADITEEVIRYYGYDNIKPTLPKNTEHVTVGKSARHMRMDKTKQIMLGLGFDEVVTYSFINYESIKKLRLNEDDYRLKAITLLNPISEEFGTMRTTMVANMLNTVLFNQNRKNSDLRLFELNRVYLPKSLPLDQLPEERTVLAFVMTGKGESFFTLKGAVEEVLESFGHFATYKASSEPFLHPGRSADIIINDKAAGFFGQVHPLVTEAFDITGDVYLAEINYDLIDVEKPAIKAALPPKFQAVERDLAFVIAKQYTAAEIGEYILKTGGKLLESAELFDVYEGDQIEAGHKSMAYSLIFRDSEKTLTDEEVLPVMNKIIRGLSYKYGAKLRA